MSRSNIALLVVAATAALLVGGAGLLWYVIQYAEVDIYVPMFAAHCGNCHGGDLNGTDTGPALVDRKLRGGDSVAALIHSINLHDPALTRPLPALTRPLPALTRPLIVDSTLDPLAVKGLAIYVAERRLGQRFVDFRFDTPLHIPTTVQAGEIHNFRIDTLVTNLSPLIFSIEPLPDGTWLVTEKERGLSIVSADGVQSEPLAGTPHTGGSFDLRGVQMGTGWLLDVAIHPDYVSNGWVYLHYTDICPNGCNDSSSPLLPASMNRLDRGHIVDGRWVDVQTVWRSPAEYYLTTPDTGAGGRIAFDDSGHVYLSVGIKELGESYDSAYGAQDLDKPFGKIHRVMDDGSIPPDNPFATRTGALPGTRDFIRQSIWTYGHRSPQGLEWNPRRGRVWESEMGPRGGDEINELLPGRNYGWPFHSLGLEYSGRAVERHRLHALEFDAADAEQTLVDITPSPAISSFAFYHGERFPGWRNNVLIGSLKGSSLLRMAFDGNRLVHCETLIRDLARIRDVEIGIDGLVYLLLENKAGSAIVRLVPADVPHGIAAH